MGSAAALEIHAAGAALVGFVASVVQRCDPREWVIRGEEQEEQKSLKAPCCRSVCPLNLQ